MPRLRMISSSENTLPWGLYIVPTTEWDDQVVGIVAVALNLPSKGEGIGPLRSGMPLVEEGIAFFDADPDIVMRIVNALANQRAKKVETAPVLTEEAIRAAYARHSARVPGVRVAKNEHIRLRELVGV